MTHQEDIPRRAAHGLVVCRSSRAALPPSWRRSDRLPTHSGARGGNGGARPVERGRQRRGRNRLTVDDGEPIRHLPCVDLRGMWDHDRGRPSGADCCNPLASMDRLSFMREGKFVRDRAGRSGAHTALRSAGERARSDPASPPALHRAGRGRNRDLRRPRADPSRRPPGGSRRCPALPRRAPGPPRCPAGRVRRSPSASPRDAGRRRTSSRRGVAGSRRGDGAPGGAGRDPCRRRTTPGAHGTRTSERARGAVGLN